MINVRAHVRTEEANVTSGCSTPPVQPKTRSSKTVPAPSHSFDLPEPKLTDLPSSPVKGATDPDYGLAVEAFGSTGDCDRDSIVGVSKSDTNQGCDESDSDSDFW